MSYLVFWLIVIGLAGLGIVIGFWVLYIFFIVVVFVVAGMFSIIKSVCHEIRLFFSRKKLKKTVYSFFKQMADETDSYSSGVNVVSIGVCPEDFFDRKDKDGGSRGPVDNSGEDKPKAKKISKTKK